MPRTEHHRPRQSEKRENPLLTNCRGKASITRVAAHERKTARRGDVTPGGEILGRRLRLAGLEREVEKLKSTIQFLASLVDYEDISAAISLAKSSPTNAELKVWASDSEPPEDILDEL